MSSRGSISQIFEEMIRYSEYMDSFSDIDYLIADRNRILRIVSGEDRSAYDWYNFNGGIYKNKPWRKEDSKKGSLVPLSEHFLVAWESNPEHEKYIRRLRRRKFNIDEQCPVAGFLKVWDGGYLVAVLCQWVPDLVGGNIKPLVPTLERDAQWNAYIRCESSELLITHAETGVVYNDHISMPQYELNYGWRVGEFVLRGLPSDIRTIAYTLCRMAGYSHEEIVDYIAELPLDIVKRLLLKKLNEESDSEWKIRSVLPHIGGYVNTALLSWWTCGFPKEGITQKREWVNWFGNDLLIEEHVPFRNYCVNLATKLNYGHEASWFRVVGSVQLQHLRWAGRNFDVDISRLELRSSQAGKKGQNVNGRKRGPQHKNPARAAWYESLGSPTYVTNEQIRLRAQVEFDEAKISNSQGFVSMSVLCQVIRRWLQQRKPAVTCERVV